MRSLVPALAFLIAGPAWSAGIPMSVEQSLQQVGCPADFSGLSGTKRIVCETHKQQYCKNGGPGCGSAPAGGTVAKVVSECKKRMNAAALCCTAGDAQACIRQIGGQPAQALETHNGFVAQITGGENLNSRKKLCQKSEEDGKNVATFASGQEGACGGRMNACRGACRQLLDSLNDNDKATATAELGAENPCGDMSPAAARQTAKDFADNAQIAETCKNDSSTEPQSTGDTQTQAAAAGA
ncbi:MAG TPA: hypothetical protein PKC28_13415, partial [Bdellovibrionales bacterium]|nr:hypothetical protein [Bdellovibrionales bacterium]